MGKVARRTKDAMITAARCLCLPKASWDSEDVEERQDIALTV